MELERQVGFPRQCEWVGKHGVQCREPAVYADLCGVHKIRALVDSHEIRAAHDVAVDQGLPASTVLRAIREAAAFRASRGVGRMVDRSCMTPPDGLAALTRIPRAPHMPAEVRKPTVTALDTRTWAGCADAQWRAEQVTRPTMPAVRRRG